MKFEIDLTTHSPVYAQIMGQVKRAIAAGELNPGDQLPTVRQLAADLRINFNTVARAYRLLDEEGIISTQHGRGTYILERPPSKESERARRRQIVMLAEYLIGEAERLEIGPNEVREIVEDQVKTWEEEKNK
ncbi:MAG: GntR family transcriptional regulator [Chloroflexi bacterium]|nr:GntR family transcriptional regulator [Chloroflexota bacterium]